MKKIKIHGIDECVYYEKLENGMDVYLYNKEDCDNNYVTFTTKFGSIYNEFVPINKKKRIRVPHGVAHFLEHKVFVQENDPQPDDFFAKSGTICNAYTTFKNTTYLFSGPNDLAENISFLLDYVQSPYFTDENVDSEKGIITQEIHMCDDNPTDVMYEHIRKNIFHNNPFKDSIIGTVEDINQIDKEVLYACYHTFYHPANMFLVVTGNFDVNEIMNVITDNQKRKHFDEFGSLDIAEYKEKDSVVKEKEMISLETEVPKMSYNIKVSLKDINMSVRKYNLYLFILLSILFDDTSLFDEEAKDEGIITNSLYSNILNCDSHVVLSLITETKYYDRVIEKIVDTLQDIQIKKEDLERKKKVLISNEIFSFENIEVINEMIIDNIVFNNKIEDNIIEIIKSLNIDEMNELIQDLDLSHRAVVILDNNE